MLPMSDKAILQQNKLRRLREEMMEVGKPTLTHIFMKIISNYMLF